MNPKPIKVLIPGMFSPWLCLTKLVYMRQNVDAVWAYQDFGLGSLDANFARIVRLAKQSERQQHRPLQVVGHSEGGYFAARLWLEWPELLDGGGARAVATPFDQIDLLPEAVVRLAGMALPAIHELLDPDRQAEFRALVAANPETAVRLDLVALALDRLVKPRRSAHALDAPAISKYFFGPKCPEDLPETIKFVDTGKRLLTHLTAIFDPAMTAQAH